MLREATYPPAAVNVPGRFLSESYGRFFRCSTYGRFWVCH